MKIQQKIRECKTNELQFTLECRILDYLERSSTFSKEHETLIYEKISYFLIDYELSPMKKLNETFLCKSTFI